MKISRTTLALVLALGLAAALSTSSVSALNWHDVLLNRPSAAHFTRPNVDLLTLSSEGPVPFSALSVWVDQTGVYTISSETEFDPKELFLAIYKAPFDPNQPLKNLIAASEVGPSGVGTVEVKVPLAAGVVYRVVTALARPQSGGDSDVFVRNALSDGPGAGGYSSCFLDEPVRSDDEVDLVLGEFCVESSWNGPSSSRGTARPSIRSGLAGSFWFRDPLRRDLEVELLDRCANNGHWWVVLSGSTTDGFQVHVRIIDAPNLEKSYSHPRGQRLTTRVDRKAFRCEDVRAAQLLPFLDL